MKIDDALISKLENLARLNLTEQEKRTIRKDLENILDMIEKLQEMDTDDIEPLRFMTTDVPKPRKDEVTSTSTRHKALELAPKELNQHFVIPKIIDK